MKNLSLNDFVGAYLKALDMPEGSEIRVNTDTGQILVCPPNHGIVEMMPTDYNQETHGPPEQFFKWKTLKFPDPLEKELKRAATAFNFLKETHREYYRKYLIYHLPQSKEIDTITQSHMADLEGQIKREIARNEP